MLPRRNLFHELALIFVRQLRGFSEDFDLVLRSSILEELGELAVFFGLRFFHMVIMLLYSWIRFYNIRTMNQIAINFLVL